MSGQHDQNLFDGVCLSARSAASHEACREGDEAGCRAGEMCMHPVLAKDEHLYKVCMCHDSLHACPLNRNMAMHSRMPLGQRLYHYIWQ